MKSLKQLGVLTKRIVKQNLTDADTLITVIGMPIFMLLFFVYVLGGNIALSKGAGSGAQAYLQYSFAGFLLLTQATGSAYTAVRINLDKTSGFLDRLQSLPIKRWLILGSHVLASVVFMLVAELLVFLVGLLLGYRTSAGVGDLLLFLVLSILFAFAITLIAIPFSLKATQAASASGFSYILMILLFVSSALMPVAGMAKPVQMFAKYQPMTPIVEMARQLLNHDLSFQSANTWQALSWLVGIIVIFGAFSYWRYRQVFSKN